MLMENDHTIKQNRLKKMTYFVHWHSYTPNQNDRLHRRFRGNHHHTQTVDLKRILDYTVPSLLLPLLQPIGIY